MLRFSLFTLILISSLPCLQSTTFRKVTEKQMQRYRQRVSDMFYHAYEGYLKYAYPYDELRPLSCDGQDTWGSFSLTLIDAMDTLVIMGNYSEFRRIADILIDKAADHFDIDINASVFETNIRVVGGLLSAHLLSRRAGMELEPGWPCSGPLLRMAEDVARKLLPAFDTPTGMPYGTVNLRHGVPPGETTVTCTAGVGTFLVELGTLSRLTGDPIFEKVAMRAMRALWEHKSPIGLVGNHVDVATGKWTAQDSGIGGGVDSYFEYLVKGTVLFQIPELLHHFREYEKVIEKHLKRDDWYMWANMKKGGITLPMFTSLDCYWPGIQCLLGDVDKAMKTLHNFHQVWKQFGFTPEYYNIPKSEAHQGREGYPLRPELIESVVYLYQATQDPYLIQVGVDILEAIEHSARTSCGYATVKDVRDHRLEDRMESFFLAETTKYLYLLFDEDNFIHGRGNQGWVVETAGGECVVETGGYVFNTEAHPIDLAAVHCCSAQKKAEDEDIQNFQDNLNILELLGISEAGEVLFPGERLHSRSQQGEMGVEGAQGPSVQPLPQPPEADLSVTLPASQVQGQGSEGDPGSSASPPQAQEGEAGAAGPSSVQEGESESEEGETASRQTADGQEKTAEPTPLHLEQRKPTLHLAAQLLQMITGKGKSDEELERERQPNMVDLHRIMQEYPLNYTSEPDIFHCLAQPFHSRISIMGEFFLDD